MDRGARQATVAWGRVELVTTERITVHKCYFNLKRGLFDKKKKLIKNTTHNFSTLMMGTV